MFLRFFYLQNHYDESFRRFTVIFVNFATVLRIYHSAKALKKVKIAVIIILLIGIALLLLSVRIIFSRHHSFLNSHACRWEQKGKHLK